MSVFVWWSIPLVALIAGIAWAYHASRPPRPAEMQESMDSFSRFRQALAHQRPTHLRPIRIDEESALDPATVPPIAPTR